MNCAGVIVDNRNQDAVVEAHWKFLPGWEMIHFNKYDIKTAADYNAIMTSVEFWEKVKEYDRVLIFQHDSELFRTGIEDFLKWDYVGAPWKFQHHGGNGGLSLRNPKTMLQVIKYYRYQGMAKQGNEDIYFCNMMKYMSLNLAPRQVCEKFSVESIFKLGTLGGHAFWKYLHPQEVEQIRSQYDN